LGLLPQPKFRATNRSAISRNEMAKQATSKDLKRGRRGSGRTTASYRPSRWMWPAPLIWLLRSPSPPAALL